MGLSHCLRAVAAVEKAVIASRDIVGYADVTLLVPHAVSLILLEQKTSHLSTARWLRYNTVLLDMPNITVKRCNVLNPATLLPTADGGDPHCCISELAHVCTPHPDLSEHPLPTPDLILYVGGSASYCPRTWRFVSVKLILHIRMMCLVAMLRPMPLEKLADEKGEVFTTLPSIPTSSGSDVPVSLSAMQHFASPEEKCQWRARSCVLTDAVWYDPDNKPCLPRHFFPHDAKLTQWLVHVSKEGK